MATNNLSNLLKTAKKTWKTTVDNKKSSGIIDFADGKYIGQLSSVVIKQSNTASATYGVTSQYLILEGEDEGKVYTEWMRLFDDDETLTTFIITRLEQLTDTPAEDLDISELETIYADAVEAGQVWQFTLKTTVSKKDGKEYQNIRLNKKVQGYESVEAATEEEEEEEAPKSAPATAKPKNTAKPAPKKAKTEAPCEIDDVVTFDLDGEDTEGTVVSIDEETEEVTVSVGTGRKAKKFAIGYAEVNVVTEDDDEGTESAYNEGDEVTFNVTTGKGKAAKTSEHTGVVQSVDDDAEELEVLETTGKGRGAVKVEHTVAFSDVLPVEETEAEEAEETEEETEAETTEVPVSVGDVVTIESDGEQVTGKVIEVDEDSEEITVKVGKKSHTVGYDAIVTEDDDDDGNDDDELQVGAKVEFTDAKTNKQLTGVVLSIDNDAETAKIKVGAKTFTVPGDEILILS